MTGKRSHYERDDELLSAYLDGELSTDERASVEAWLAADPAAQQLLHELRSVSQSVQALPTETPGRDLSEEIIRRAREVRSAQSGPVVRGSSDPAQASDRRSPGSAERETFGPVSGEVGRPAPNSQRSGDTVPKFRLFSSKRAWIWASMALAAGLLLMIVQSGDEPANKLPSMAARNKEGPQTLPTGEAGQPARRERALSAVPKAASPPPATLALDGQLRDNVDAMGAANKPAGAMPEASSRQLSSSTKNGGRTGAPIVGAGPAPGARTEEERTALVAVEAPSTSTAQPGQIAADRQAGAPQPTAGRSATSSALSVATNKQEAVSIANQNPQRFVVVRVVAKPEALKNGSFERLLAEHKIEFEPHFVTNDSLSFGGGKLSKPAQNKIASQEQSNTAAETHASPTEMVVVEAPASTIESCLADLNKNSDDFLSIAVNEDLQLQDRFDVKLKSTPAKKLAEKSTNLSRFNRGVLPADQKDIASLHDYYAFNKPTEPSATGSRAGGLAGEASTISGAEQDKSGNKKRNYKDQSVPEIRRARRMETLGTETRQAGEPAGFGPTSSTSAAGPEARVEQLKERILQRMPTGNAEAKADTNDNDLKVLFVFTSAEAPASSAPSDNRPK